MWDYVFGIGELFNDYVGRLDRVQWFWVSIIILGLGFMCMRGFGSRTNY